MLAEWSLWQFLASEWQLGSLKRGNPETFHTGSPKTLAGFVFGPVVSMSYTGFHPSEAFPVGSNRKQLSPVGPVFLCIGALSTSNRRIAETDDV